uniref:Propyzamide hydrolase/amidase n=1 Tax=Comamonas sp. W1 TaxID=1564691 RepID=A0A0A0V7L0_9BURK|nr:propyzamide hydrolase/amidase [Comamonas sp. W1]
MSIKGIMAQDALEIARMVKSGAISAAEILEETITRVEAVNPALNFMAVKAYEVGRDIVSQPLKHGAFEGVPFLQKDIGGLWPGVRVTNGSMLWKDYVLGYTSFTAQKVMDAGFVMFGGTTTPDWGFGGNTTTKLHGVTRNPWDPGRIPGGSSGGAAVAVATRAVPFAHASDGAGSARIPAAFCGVVGLKVSRGRIPFGPQAADGMYGFVSDGSISISVRDSAAFLDVVANSVPGEIYPHTPRTETFLASIERPMQKLRIGYVTTTPSGSPLGKEASIAVQTAAKLCADLGHNVEEAKFILDIDELIKRVHAMGDVQHAALVFFGEAVAGRKAGPDDLTDFMREAADLGLRKSALEHADDVEQLRMFARLIAAQTTPYDVLISPTVPIEVPDIDWCKMWGTAEAPFDMADYMRVNGEVITFTVPFNCSGQPAISLPLHWTNSGMPFGVQFVGAYGREDVLLNLAAQLELAAPWKDKVPPINALG